MSTSAFPALDTAIALRRALARLNRRLRTQGTETELSVAQHSLLGHLYRVGAMTPGALALEEGVQPQSLTRVLADLEESGHILRQPDPVDRRQSQLELTQKGREALERDARRRALWLASAMTSSLSPTEQELLRLASQLMDRLADLPIGLNPDVCHLVAKED